MKDINDREPLTDDELEQVLQGFENQMDWEQYLPDSDWYSRNIDLIWRAMLEVKEQRAELARVQAECAALKAANADLHLMVDRTPEGDRHGKIAR